MKTITMPLDEYNKEIADLKAQTKDDAISGEQALDAVIALLRELSNPHEAKRLMMRPETYPTFCQVKLDQKMTLILKSIINLAHDPMRRY